MDRSRLLPTRCGTRRARLWPLARLGVRSAWVVANLRPPGSEPCGRKPVDVPADNGNTCRYCLAEWAQCGPSATDTFLYRTVFGGRISRSHGHHGALRRHDERRWVGTTSRGHHDWATAREGLAAVVHGTATTTQSSMAPTNLIGIDDYMHGPIEVCAPMRASDSSSASSIRRASTSTSSSPTAEPTARWAPVATSRVGAGLEAAEAAESPSLSLECGSVLGCSALAGPESCRGCRLAGPSGLRGG